MILRRVRKIVRGLPDPISGPFVRRGLLIDHSRAEGVLCDHPSPVYVAATCVYVKEKVE